MTKLSDNEVLEIIKLKQEGLTQSKIALIYNIHQSQVSRYLNNKTRNNLGEGSETKRRWG